MDMSEPYPSLTNPLPNQRPQKGDGFVDLSRKSELGSWNRVYVTAEVNFGRAATRPSAANV